MARLLKKEPGMSLRRWLPAMLALVALACARSADIEGSANQMTPIDTTCAAGEVVFCACSSGTTGERRCLPDGSGFGDCQCSAEGDTLPVGWICTPDRYGDGSCDCTCGAEDPECAPGQCGGAGGTAGSGGGSAGSGAGGSGAGGGLGGAASGAGGGSGTPAGWQCDPTWYGDGQFCDCNCGIADPDCSTSQCSSGSPTGCSHSACVAGAPLANWCSPCALAVCAIDSYCCNTAWDDTCVLSASLLCSC